MSIPRDHDITKWVGEVVNAVRGVAVAQSAGGLWTPEVETFARALLTTLGVDPDELDLPDVQGVTVTTIRPPALPKPKDDGTVLIVAHTEAEIVDL